MIRRPEILAPAGAPDCLPAAVAGGADAVYLGLRHFNARGRAANFHSRELGDHVAYLHTHGLRCYVVLNTLLWDDEFTKALRLAHVAYHSNVDAVIVQDLGLWRVLARELPDLPRHASTQMTIHCPEQVAELARLGAERIILARELSLSDIATCARTAAKHGVEIEHFVHGALCYAFSGQCLMSNLAGCRSANRGTCAQNCRFVYHDDAHNANTILSMRDFNLIDRVADLMNAGVSSFKIEGRLKDPNYVYTVAQSYRQAVDACLEGEVAPTHEALRYVFTRGFTNAPLDGCYDASGRLSRRDDNESVADALIERLDRRDGRVLLRQAVAPRPGQGYRFRHGDWDDGFLITGVDRIDDERWRCRIRITRRGPTPPSGTPAWCNRDQDQEQASRQAIAAATAVASRGRQRTASLQCHGSIGSPLTAILVCSDGARAEATSETTLQAARSRPLDRATIAETLGAFGADGIRLVDCQVDIKGEAFLPARDLKRLRRALVAALPTTTHEVESGDPLPPPARAHARRTRLIVAVDDISSAWTAQKHGADEIWLSLEALGDAWSSQSPQVPALPRMTRLRHPASEGVCPHIAEMQLPIVCGHLGVVAAARQLGLACSGDVGLNVCNVATATTLHEAGCELVVLSLEHSARDIARLVRRSQVDPQLGVIVHGRIPSMLTWQDHNLAPGEQKLITASEREGGLPYRLVRRGGRSTVVYEERLLCAPEAALATRGLVDAWVLELALCDTTAVADQVAAYRALLDDDLGPKALRARAATWSTAGCFPGHLHRGSRALDTVADQAVDASRLDPSGGEE